MALLPQRPEQALMGGVAGAPMGFAPSPTLIKRIPRLSAAVREAPRTCDCPANAQALRWIRGLGWRIVPVGGPERGKGMRRGPLSRGVAPLRPGEWVTRGIGGDAGARSPSRRTPMGLGLGLGGGALGGIRSGGAAGGVCHCCLVASQAGVPHRTRAVRRCRAQRPQGPLRRLEEGATGLAVEAWGGVSIEPPG